MKQNKLYNLDSKGKLRSWSISVETNNDYSTLVIESGLEDGKKVIERIDIKEGKNTGKKNETTHYTQAVLEAESKLKSKIKKGYVYNPENVQFGTLSSGIKKPMKAHKFDPTGKQKNSKTLEQMDIIGKIIYVQPKYDGNRCIARLTDNTIELFTQSGDKFPNIEHITNQLRECFIEYNSFNKVEEVTLDGELFSNKLTFNEFNGLLNKKEFSEDDLEKLATAEFRLYDIDIDQPYKERFTLLQDILDSANNPNAIKLIENYVIKANNENLLYFLDKFLSEGHEGLMFRIPDKGGYENKRTWNLVKYKVFEDEEYEIVDLIQSVTGNLGKFVLKAPPGLIDRSGKPILTFEAGITGITHKQGRDMFTNKNEYIGKQGTVVFQLRSEYGVPRFGKLKSIRYDYVEEN